MDERDAESTLLAAWTFHRQEEWVTIRRETTAAGGFQIVVIENNQPRVYPFESLERLASFQHEMEVTLVNAGWSLAEFAPDRRLGGDRRGAPRATGDRRRWWTNVKR